MCCIKKNSLLPGTWVTPLSQRALGYFAVLLTQQLNYSLARVLPIWPQLTSRLEYVIPLRQWKQQTSALKKHDPRLKIWGTSWLTSFQRRFRPNYRYKTDRPDLDGARFDIHSAIEKLPAPQRSWILHQHSYTGPQQSSWTTIEVQSGNRRTYWNV